MCPWPQWQGSGQEQVKSCGGLTEESPLSPACLALAATFAIGAAVRDDPAAALGGNPGEMRRRSSQFLLMSFDHKVPQWLSPREKLRRRSETCAAAIMR